MCVFALVRGLSASLRRLRYAAKKQIGIAAGKRAEAHVLVVGVSEERIAGTKIHRRNTDLAEPRHVCPPVFGFGFLPDSRDK